MGQLAVDMLEHASRNAQPSGLRQSFKASRDVYAVPVEVIAFHHHITEINSDAEHDLLLFRYVCIRRMHRGLQFDGPFDGIDSAGELNQYAVAHELHNSAAISGYKRLENFSATAFEYGQSTGFVALHKAAVANYIGGQDS